MNIIKYALFIAALSLPVTNTHALEWVDYDGTIPDNAVMVNEGVEDRPICRRNARIGLIKNDLCHSVKAGGDFDKKDIDDGYQILVDTYNAYEVAELDSKPEYGTWMFEDRELRPVSGENTESYCGDMFPLLFDEAVAEATSGLIPPGDCGNSEEEAFEAGVSVARFSMLNNHGSGVRGPLSPDFQWNGTSSDDLIRDAKIDYLNGRCVYVPEEDRPTASTNPIFPEETWMMEYMPLACESFFCSSDSQTSDDGGPYVSWSLWSGDIDKIYCRNAARFRHYKYDGVAEQCEGHWEP